MLSQFIAKANELIPADHPAVARFERQLDAFLAHRAGFLQPYVPAVGRLLIVATFYEDSYRIVTQWREQVYYLATFRRLYEWVVRFLLFVIISTMVTASTVVVSRVGGPKAGIVASGALAFIVVLQGLLYGLMFDFTFLLRNVSLIGGLLLSLSDSLVVNKRAMAGVPMLEHKDYNKKYFLLAGRTMLIVMFGSFVLTVKWSSFLVIPVVLVGMVACLAITIGYKTKLAAGLLTLLLFIHNLVTNHYWTYALKDSRRDYLRYEFFQTLSIVGGLLLIVNTGAGELSVDEKKKRY